MPLGDLARQDDPGGFVDTVDPDLAKYPPDYNASNYSVQPPYRRPEPAPDARWMIGALAANDAYRPDEGGANAALWRDPNEIAAARLRGSYVNQPRRVGDDPFTVMGQGMIEDIAAPGKLMQPNPYPPGSEEAGYYDLMRQEGANTWGRSMALNTMGTGAAVGVPVKGAETVLGAGSIRAYHGSPHDFDRFDLSKIGTGEGAQAYGHGLYFAGNENVARGYRDALAPKALIKPGADMLDPQRIAAELFDSYRGQNLKDALGDAKFYDNGAAVADELRKIYANPPKGHMYEVNINADPAQMLDWDKPLAAQPENVKSALFNTGIVQKDIGQPGSAIVKLASDPAGASRFNQAGIPGIRYLDAGSRGKGTGSSNYVVFNPSIIDIMRKYGIAGAAPAGLGALAAQDYYKGD